MSDASSPAQRIPGVPSLTTKLPKGTEGGKEFARLVTLLLHHEAGQNGGQQFVIDDASGDYAGLDSMGRPNSKSMDNGYQFKFFPSPLSDTHRAEIEASLKVAIEKHNDSRIKKWVLVTPDDLTETERRKSGGDASWFNGLRLKHRAPFGIDHIGHTKLIHLFMQCPMLCLYYYPELVLNGVQRRGSITSVLAKYNKQLLEAHGKIEFVGMSVYKDEAARGVPLEEIYIPLSLVNRGIDKIDDDTPRITPVSLLTPGSYSVVLGDPGSGKSTLLTCLALAGALPALQKRIGAVEDSRLSILVTLRRYADELKTRKNLGLADYIVESCRADFCIPEIDWDFFDFYLSSGKAKVFFDGLDELPSPNFKRIVRDRIRAFSTSYPQNSVIISSRIVGYEGGIRFREEQFKHFKVAQLRLSEIEAFINDWYRIRVDNDVDRKANANDLLRIVRQPENAAIRELASNPLLLTIVALVHRIDAVLPDQRVVLYRKCTETLLDTWYKWKYRADEEVNKGRIERRNRQRIEAIAHWMQAQASGEVGRAVAPLRELRDFLRLHISKNEPQLAADLDPEEAADEFLKFVRERTGLLIEVGDEKYSFVHLTFQEYLTATFLATDGETDGVAAIWAHLEHRIFDPRWQEVIRLLVASFRSDASQQFFVDRLIGASEVSSVALAPMTPAGLLLDGIEAAEVRADEILLSLVRTGLSASTIDTLQAISRLGRLWLSKGPRHADQLLSAFDRLADNNGSDLVKLRLLAACFGLPPKQIEAGRVTDASAHVYNALLCGVPVNRDFVSHWHEVLERVWGTYDLMSTISPDMNIISAASQSLVIRMEGGHGYRHLFRRQMVAGRFLGSGPFTDLTSNTLAIALATVEHKPTLYDRVALHQDHRRDGKAQPRSFGLVAREIDKRARKEGRSRSLKSSDQHYFSTLSGKFSELDIRHMEGSNLIGRTTNLEAIDPWRLIQAYPQAAEAVLYPLLKGFSLQEMPHWQTAISTCMFPHASETIAHALSLETRTMYMNILADNPDNEEAGYYASWVLLLDAWSIINGPQPHVSPDDVLTLLETAKRTRVASLQIAAAMHQFVITRKAHVTIDALFIDNEEAVWAELDRCGWTSQDHQRIEDSLVARSSRKQVARRNMREPRAE